MKQHRIMPTMVACLASMLAGCASQRQAAGEREASATEGHIQITRAGSAESINGTSEHFTGAAVIDLLYAPNAHRHASAATVEFAQGARTVWHTHPAGQTLVVTKGKGWVQSWGGEKYEMSPGDVVWIPPGVKHWHGATSNERMTHLAVQEQLDGKVVAWMEAVADEQYSTSGASD